MGTPSSKNSKSRPTISEVIRRLVEESEESWMKIATGSGVNYQTLQKWMKDEVKSLSADNAERLHIYLTGNPFTQP